MLGPVAIAMGIGSAAAFGLAALSRRQRRAKTIAGCALFAGWALANATNSQEAELVWPIMDAFLGCGFMLAWVDAPARWKIQLFGLFMMQTMCHVCYHVALALGANFGYGYTAALNALFLCQLWVVGSDGAQRGRDYLRDWIASSASRLRPYGAGAFARKAR